MSEKPKQYYDTRRHQLYYQWSESEYFSYQEPIYDRTKEYIESLETENTKLREFIRLKEMCWKHVGFCYECPYNGVDDEHDDCNCTVQEEIDSLARELGIEV